MVFEKAWRFLKASRQTELGEFHPDFPSSYGPVRGARYTKESRRKQIQSEGMKALPTKGWKHYHGESMPEKAVWAWMLNNNIEPTTSNMEKVVRMVHNMGGEVSARSPTGAMNVWGIRGNRLNDAYLDESYSPDEFGERQIFNSYAITQNIPPEALVRIGRTSEWARLNNSLYPEQQKRDQEFIDYENSVKDLGWWPQTEEYDDRS